MSNLKYPITERDHTRGAKDPQLQIVEYGDFQCPYCALAEPIMQKAVDEFGSVVSLTFRNFPLTEMHVMAYPAAAAAEAAGKQGKYWEIHDFIFRNQKLLSNDLLVNEAKNFDLDVNQFVADCNSEETKNKIESDFEGGAMSGVNGTPSFFVNDKKFDGGAEDLYRLIAENITY